MDDRERELELELALREHESKQGQATHMESLSPRAPRPASQWSDIPAGLMSGLKDVGYGTLQRAAEISNMLPSMPRAGVGGMGPSTSPNAAEMLRQNLVRQRAEAAQQPPQSITHGISEAVGSSIPAMGLAAGTGGYSIPASAMIGAFSGALRPSVSNAETATNAAIEGGMAGGLTAGTRFFMPRNMAEPEHMKSIAAGRGEGLTYSGGQIADSPIIQRGEAHAIWNPLVKAQAIEQRNTLNNQYITALLKQTGMDAKDIPKNPSLDPETLLTVAKQVGARLDEPFVGKAVVMNTPATQKAVATAAQASRELPEEDAKIVAAEIKRANNLLNTRVVSGEEVQGKLRRMMETAGRLDGGVGGRGGNKEAADIVEGLHDVLLNRAIPDDAARAAYANAKSDYARFMTIEDTLRASKGMGKGTPDLSKLAPMIEKAMPGGVTRNKSTMADLARGAQIGEPLGALPDRAHEFMTFGDIPNAISFARWNNPAAKFGLLHPGLRDAADLGRFIPGAYQTPQSAPGLAPGLFGPDPLER